MVGQSPLFLRQQEGLLYTHFSPKKRQHAAAVAPRSEKTVEMRRAPPPICAVRCPKLNSARRQLMLSRRAGCTLQHSICMMKSWQLHTVNFTIRVRTSDGVIRAESPIVLTNRREGRGQHTLSSAVWRRIEEGETATAAETLSVWVFGTQQQR